MIKKSKKVIIALLAVDLLVSSTMIGTYKYQQYKQNQIVEIEQQKTIQLANTVYKFENEAEERFNTGAPDRNIADFLEEVTTIASYMNCEEPELKEEFIQTLLRSIDWELASNQNLSLLNVKERHIVEQTIASWKMSDWSNIKKQQKDLNEIKNKYKH